MNINENSVSDISAASNLIKLERISLNKNGVDSLESLKGLTELKWITACDNNL